MRQAGGWVAREISSGATRLRSITRVGAPSSMQGETQLGWSLREFSEPTPCTSEQSFTPLNDLVSHVPVISYDPYLEHRVGSQPIGW